MAQTVRSNEQMMQSMKGATSLLGTMNRSMNLPALQRIAMEFEKENDIMDQRQEMMDDSIDDVTGLEDEAEGEEVVKEVLDEIGVDLGQAVGGPISHVCKLTCVSWERRPAGSSQMPPNKVALPRPSEVTRETMTFRRGWIACGDTMTRATLWCGRRPSALLPVDLPTLQTADCRAIMLATHHQGQETHEPSARRVGVSTVDHAVTQCQESPVTVDARFVRRPLLIS